MFQDLKKKKGGDVGGSGGVKFRGHRPQGDTGVDDVLAELDRAERGLGELVEAENTVRELEQYRVPTWCGCSTETLAEMFSRINAPGDPGHLAAQIEEARRFSKDRHRDKKDRENAGKFAQYADARLKLEGR